MFHDDIVFVCDVDGTLTDGKMYYTEQGKYMKAFGCDDWDILKELMKYMKIVFVTADKKGYLIVKKRIEEEMKFELNLVSHKPKERWEWIKNRFPSKKIIYMGDGCFDVVCLENADYSFCPANSLDYVKDKAFMVTSRHGGDRAVAEACVYIMSFVLNEDWWESVS